jgi:hypothetical protein
MENKKTINAVIIIFAIWLILLSVLYIVLYNKSANNNSTTASSSATGITTGIINRHVSDEESSLIAINSEGKIFGKYKPEDFASFSGVFISKIVNGTSTVLVISGAPLLKQEVMSNNPPSTNFQEGIRYIEIGKNTKIVDDQGNAVQIGDLAQEDYITVIPQDITDYASSYMLAGTITVTKKTWPEGENPF